MNKTIKQGFICIILLINCISIFSQSSKISEDEKIQFAMLMNQVQYSISNIEKTMDKEILTQEFDFIINQIDKSKLYEPTIERMYTDLLESLKNCTLSENERTFIIEMNERERKQAYTKALSSFGSVFNAGFSPVSLVTSIAYAGISANLNIANEKYEADNKLKQQIFKIDQEELNETLGLKEKLFKAYTKIITGYKLPNEYEISDTEMNDLLKQLKEQKDNHQNLIENLGNKKGKFIYFPVYWYQLGAQYQYIGNIQKALECYNQFEKLTEKYSYLKTDPYYISVAKNTIEILRKQGIGKNTPQILKYLKIIEKNLIPENESENRVFLAGVYFELGLNEKAKSLVNINISRNEYYAVSTDILSLIQYEETKALNTLNPSLLLELSAISLNISDKNNSDFTISIPRKFCENKFVYLKYNNKLFANPIFVEPQDLSEYQFIYKIGINELNNSELVLGIINEQNQQIELTFDCTFIQKNSDVSNLLNELNMNIDNIEPCLISNTYDKLKKFSYDPNEDKEYIDLVDAHKLQTDKLTSKQQKELFEKKEKEKYTELKTKGRLREISNRISEASKDLQNYPYFCSKLAHSEKDNLLCYSLKNVKYFSDEYEFNKYGIGTKRSFTNISYSDYITNLLTKNDKDSFYELYKAFCTGNDVSKDGSLAFRYLVLAANNDNANAQYDLATVYADTSSKLSKFFVTEGLVIPNTGIIKKITNIPKKNDSIEKEIIASYWYKKAADNGHGNATYEYAKRLESGMGVEKDTDTAKKYYIKAYYDYGILEAEKKI